MHSNDAVGVDTPCWSVLRAWDFRKETSIIYKDVRAQDEAFTIPSVQTEKCIIFMKLTNVKNERNRPSDD